MALLVLARTQVYMSVVFSNTHTHALIWYSCMGIKSQTRLWKHRSPLWFHVLELRYESVLMWLVHN